MVNKLIRKGYIKENDPRFTTIKHNFGKALKSADFYRNSDDEHSCDSQSSYDTDEVHDTRSFIVGYYRRPEKQDDEELKLFHQ